MGKKKTKSFIDRKQATAFRLLHRSQRDPLIADEEHGERVLHPLPGEDLEERRKFGIYYTDNYNYLQHLKRVGETIEVDGAETVEHDVIHADNPLNKLPSCIFETKGVELRVGLMNQAAASNELLPNIDPDIASALEDENIPMHHLAANKEESDDDQEEIADEFGDELEDNFIQLANDGNDEGDVGDKGQSWEVGAELRNEDAGREEMLRRFGLIRPSKAEDSEEEGEDEDKEENEEELEEAKDELTSLGTTREDRKSRFTNYSMSSAVIKRPDGLRQIDDHFESLYATQYKEELEGEGSETDVDDGGADEHSKSLDDPNNSKRIRALLAEGGEGELIQRFQREVPDPELKEAVLRYAEAQDRQVRERDETEQILLPSDDAKRARWDCETIVSTYSTLYNHPTEIREHSIASLDVAGKKVPLTRDNLHKMEKMDIDQQSVRSSRASTASTFRPKDETTEERRIRKRAIKDERRERRQEKKANRVAFHQQKLAMDAQRYATAHMNVRPIH